MFYGIQQGAIKALQLSNEWFLEQNKIYENRRRLIWEMADKLNTTYSKDSSGLFVWAKLSKDVNEEDFTNKILYENDIFITPGSVFGSQGKGYIRFSLCVTSSTIKEALARL